MPPKRASRRCSLTFTVLGSRFWVLANSSTVCDETASGAVAGMHCAPVATVYIFQFTPRAAGGPSVVVTLGGCPHAYGITVNGRQQPSLWDDGKLRMAAAALVGVR